MDALIKNKLVEKSQEVFTAIKMSNEGRSEVLDELEESLKIIEIGERREELVTFVQWDMVIKEQSEDEINFNTENGRKRRGKKESK